jgi:hypothetical protein
MNQEAVDTIIWFHGFASGDKMSVGTSDVYHRKIGKMMNGFELSVIDNICWPAPPE